MAIKQRNCQKGYTCGNTCISKTRNCKKQLQGQVTAHAKWLVENAGVTTGLLKQMRSTIKGKKTPSAKKTKSKGKADFSVGIPDND